MRTSKSVFSVLALGAGVVFGMIMSACEPAIVFQDGLSLREVKLNKSYSTSSWQVTPLKIDEVQQSCLFRVEDCKKGAAYTDWVKVGDNLKFAPEQIMNGIMLYEIEKEKITLGLLWGRVHTKYQLKDW